MEEHKNLNGFAISNKLFEWIKTNLPEGKTILEFGSGYGTIELTKRWKVYSIEQNEEWIGKAPKSTYIHAPLREYPHIANKWFDIEKIMPHLPIKYDLMLIDAPTGIGRLGILAFWDFFQWDVPIIVDDTNRHEELLLANFIGDKLKKEAISIFDNDKASQIIA